MNVCRRFWEDDGNADVTRLGKGCRQLVPQMPGRRLVSTHQRVGHRLTLRIIQTG